MNLKKTAALLVAAFAMSASAEDGKEENTKPGCGNSASIRTAIGIIRDEYGMGERKLELVGIRTTARDADLGNYSCAASVQFEATHGDQIMRKGLFQPPGEKTRIPFRFDIYADAVDPDQTIVSVKRIRALEVNL